MASRSSISCACPTQASRYYEIQLIVAGEHWWLLTLFCPALHQVQPCPHYWGQSDIALENSKSKLQQTALLIFRKPDSVLAVSPFLSCCSFWLLETPVLKYDTFHGLPITLPILCERMFACPCACSGVCPGMPKDTYRGWEGAVLCVRRVTDQCLQTTGGWGAQVCDGRATQEAQLYGL